MDRFDNVNDTPNYQDSDRLNHTFDTQVGSMYNVSKAIAQQDKFIDEIDTRKGYSKTETDELLSVKADADNVYTKTEIDDLLDNVYTKTETDDLLDTKADADNVYTKTETNDLLNAKADADNVYTKTETNDLLNAKADADNVYTKTETDNLLMHEKIFATDVTTTGNYSLSLGKKFSDWKLFIFVFLNENNEYYETSIPVEVFTFSTNRKFNTVGGGFTSSTDRYIIYKYLNDTQLSVTSLQNMKLTEIWGYK